MENGPIEIVDLPSYKIVIFHSFLLVYQRVPIQSVDPNFPAVPAVHLQNSRAPAVHWCPGLTGRRGRLWWLPPQPEEAWEYMCVTCIYKNICTYIQYTYETFMCSFPPALSHIYIYIYIHNIYVYTIYIYIYIYVHMSHVDFVYDVHMKYICTIWYAHAYTCIIRCIHYTIVCIYFITLCIYIYIYINVYIHVYKLHVYNTICKYT